jgi:hypothetical protein
MKQCNHQNCFLDHHSHNSGIHLIENDFLKKPEEAFEENINHIMINFIKYNYERTVTLR